MRWNDWVEFDTWADLILHKGGAKAPPGFTPVPNSRAGLWRKRVGAKWVYWHPESSRAPVAPEDNTAKREESLAAASAYLGKHSGSGGLGAMSAEEHVATARAALRHHEERLPDFLKRLTALSGEGASVKGRVKELHSALTKVAMKHREKTEAGKKTKYAHVGDLQDLTGARVIYNTTAEVMKTVKATRAAFEIVEEDDYVTTPKEGTGYRSFHMILKDADGTVRELQIRTQNMNAHADWCHDLYKPVTTEQRSFMANHRRRSRAWAYSVALADALAKRDQGEPNAPLPEPPPGLLRVFPHNLGVKPTRRT